MNRFIRCILYLNFFHYLSAFLSKSRFSESTHAKFISNYHLGTLNRHPNVKSHQFGETMFIFSLQFSHFLSIFKENNCYSFQKKSVSFHSNCEFISAFILFNKSKLTLYKSRTYVQCHLLATLRTYNRRSSKQLHL